MLEDEDEDYIDDYDDYLDEDEEEFYSDEESDTGSDDEQGGFICSCNFHGQHWSQSVNIQRFTLRQLVQNQLITRFELMPSLILHRSLLSIAMDPDAIELQMQKILSLVATSSSDTFAAALNIYSMMGNVIQISALLDSHHHLLRPRDALVLQNAVTTLSEHPFYQVQSLKILENELMDIIRCLRASILPLFCNIDIEANKQEITQIAKLRQGSAQRQDRVERWVDAVITPGTNAPHPMAFAAFMMGLPIAPGMDDADDADPLGYLDQADPDLEDLREEFKPKLRERFDGWTEVALVMKGGAAMLIKVYSQVVTLMPFLRLGDVVEELISRYAESIIVKLLISLILKYIHGIGSPKSIASIIFVMR